VGVLVVGDQDAQARRIVLGVPDSLDGGELGGLTGDDVLEHLARGVGVRVDSYCIDVVVGVEAGDVVGGNVERGVLAGTGGDDVEVLAAHLTGDQRVGGVDRGALGAVDGRGVAQLDVCADVVGGQDRASAVARALDG